MREILDGVTRAGGGSFELQYDRITPVTVNHRELAQRLHPTLTRIMGDANVVNVPPTTGAEDFAFFANVAPTFFYRLGTTPPGQKSGDHHTPTFIADDSAIPIGMRTMTGLVLDYLRNGAAQ